MPEISHLTLLFLFFPVVYKNTSHIMKVHDIKSFQTVSLAAILPYMRVLFYFQQVRWGGKGTYCPNNILLCFLSTLFSLYKPTSTTHEVSRKPKMVIQYVYLKAFRTPVGSLLFSKQISKRILAQRNGKPLYRLCKNPKKSTHTCMVAPSTRSRPTLSMQCMFVERLHSSSAPQTASRLSQL